MPWWLAFEELWLARSERVVKLIRVARRWRRSAKRRRGGPLASCSSSSGDKADIRIDAEPPGESGGEAREKEGEEGGLVGGGGWLRPCVPRRVLLPPRAAVKEGTREEEEKEDSPLKEEECETALPRRWSC